VRVGVIAYLLHAGADYRSAGVSTYILNLLLHLPRECPEHSYVAFVAPDAPLSSVREVAFAPASTHNPMLRIAWEQLALPFQARSRRVDLLHGTVNAIPVLAPVPAVVTVHDLAFLRHPERFRPGRVAYLKAAVSISLKRARRVIAVSQSTKSDLMHLLAVPEERVTVVYPGVDESFRPLETELVEGFRARATGGRRYILHVGTLEPRKNIDVLIRAYATLRKSGFEHSLVLVGARGWMYETLFHLVGELGLGDDVSFVDYVDRGQLPLWYNGADLFAYPSAYEGFGLPVLEAMACGVPVVTSSSSSLAEVAGSACLTVEPGSQEALQVALANLLKDQDVRVSLARAGLLRAAQFSWTATARGTVSVYESAL
jgi:glycosyltransferase involved in cell wall biosynthesis